jgi:hypothetical protein
MSAALLWSAVVVGGAAALLVAGVVLFLLFNLPLTFRFMRLLPSPGRSTVDGVTTIDDAVRSCRASGLTGLPLVAYAQRLAARKFSYSRRNPWDGWARAFERGMGYCIQQALALKLIYDDLGVKSRTVQAFRASFPAGLVNGVWEPGSISGHVWLRVRVEGREYDVCPGGETNSPGVTHFTPRSPVVGVPRFSVPLLHLLCAAENARRERRAAAGGAKA